MLVMVNYTFEGGSSGRAAYDRFSQWKPSAGLELKGGWAAASNAGGFLLVEAVNEGVLLEFLAQFKDLNKEVQVTPVVELNEAVTIVQKAYKWVDSVS
jgi:Protein of unknown function (DUF3303)